MSARTFGELQPAYVPLTYYWEDCPSCNGTGSDPYEEDRCCLQCLSTGAVKRWREDEEAGS